MASVAAAVLPIYERVTGRRFWTMRQELRRLQWSPRETLEARALERLRALVGHAVRHVPHYRDVARRLGFQPGDLRTVDDLAVLPSLDRALLRAGASADLVATAVPPARRRRVRTSGSTGEPVEFFQDRAELDPQWASLLLFQEWAGIGVSDVRIVIAGRTAANADLSRWTRIPAWVRRGVLGSRTLALPAVEASAPRLHALTAALPRGRRYHLVAYPSSAARVAREIQEGGPAPLESPTVVVCGGESLTPGDAGVMAAAFRCPVVSRYSAWEATFVAQTCPDHPALLHVNTERAWLRVLRADGRDAGPGESGRILLTNLWNHVTPLINYDVGDLATVGDPCPCGRGFPTLQRVEGRAAEVIRTAGGMVVSPAALCNFLTFEHPVLGDVTEFQVAQTAADTVVLRVVPTARFAPATAAALTEAFQRFLGPGMRVRVEPIDRIPNLPSGKRRLIEAWPE